MIGLTVVGALSPLLTFVSLFQLKEWRLDRLKEHLKREGFARQLCGKIRPVLVLLFLLSNTGWYLLLRSQGDYPEFGTMLFMILTYAGWLLLFAALSLLQMFLRAQRVPVTTQKACLVILLTIVLTVVCTSFGQQHEPIFVFLTPLILLLQPLLVLVAWLLLSPLDAFLKKRRLKRAMNLRNSHHQLTVIGITGSVGKTTTKELLAHILKKRGALATPVHVNTEMGVAAWLSLILKDKPKDWMGTLIIEMGAYCAGEIARLCKITKPSLGIITYIGAQHISLFGSLEAIREAKGELLRALPANGHAFINHDNEASATLAPLPSCTLTSVGTDGKADLNALDIEETAHGLRFTVSHVPFEVPIAGTHTITSILLAVSAAQTLGMDLPSIARELRTFKPIARTFEVKTIRGVTVLDDTYNSSPDSLRAAISWAAAQPEREKTLLVDGIIELGESEVSIHEKLAAEAANIFSRVCVANTRFLDYFRKGGFGDRAIALSSRPKKVSVGSLLVCVGRVPKTAIDELLP